jgi:hypothetical protein
MSRRNIIIIIVAILAIAAAGVAGYFLLYAPTQEIPEEAQLTPEERARLTLTQEEVDRGLTLEQKARQLEQARRLAIEEGQEIEPVVVEEPDVKPIIEKEILNATLAPDRQNLIYFDREEQDFVIADLDGGSPRTVTSQDFQNVYDINWSQERDSAIVVTSQNDGEDKQYSYVNLRDQSVINYDSKYQGVALNPNGSRIAYLFYDEENDISNISVANTDTTEFQTLYSYPDPNVELNWFDDEYIQFNPGTSGYKQGEIGITDAEGETYRVILGDKYGVSTLHSPDNSLMIYNASETKNPRKLKLFVTDNQGASVDNYLGVDTLTEKCAWALDNVTLYCAVPDFYSESLVMPNDYYNERFYSTDSFYRIDTAEQRATIIKASSDLDEIYDAFQPYLSADGSVFYFTNRLDGQLKALTIPQ